MELFILDNLVVFPHPQALLIPEFKDIWMRDTSENKETAMKELTFVEFMCSPKKTNPFWGYDEAVRGQHIIEKVFGEQGFTPDDVTERAIQVYRTFLYDASPTLSMLDSARNAVTNLKQFLNGQDILQERNRNGMPIYKPQDITKAINDLGTTAKSLDELQKRVEQEIFETTKLKGNNEANPLER